MSNQTEHHLKYDRDMMGWCAQVLPKSGDQASYNAVYAAFCVYAHNILEFYDSPSEYRTKMKNEVLSLTEKRDYNDKIQLADIPKILELCNKLYDDGHKRH